MAGGGPGKYIVGGSQKMSKKRILVVDDEMDLIKAVEIRLAHAGYEVIMAHDGQEGLEKAKKEMPDLIVLDVMLPKMEGHKVCGLLKADTRYNRIPIILFSAKSQESDIALGREAGADAYIVKPFDSKKLLATIDGLIHKENGGFYVP
jgi:DNA-binding response OmpR family regulator